jgi:hypothetical protein
MTTEVPFVIPSDLAQAIRRALEGRPFTGYLRLDFHEGCVGAVEIVEKFKRARRDER